jgi:hypothetical protein
MKKEDWNIGVMEDWTKGFFLHDTHPSNTPSFQVLGRMALFLKNACPTVRLAVWNTAFGGWIE